MPRFFVQQDKISDDSILITGEDARHIARALRMAVGDDIVICDMSGNEYSCIIEKFNDDTEVYTRVVSKSSFQNEPCIYIRIFQALPKGDKLDTIIQKAVECGASEIIPFQSERCVVKMKDEQEERKNVRRQKISAAAAKQCGRSIIPQIHKTVDFDTALTMASQSELCLFCYEGKGTEQLGAILREYSKLPPTVSVVIGSEGGFSKSEVDEAISKRVRLTGLGKRILRTETASGFVLACLVCKSEL